MKNSTNLVFENRREETTGLDRFLSPKEAASYLGISIRIMYELMLTKRISSQPIGNRLRRIRHSTLEAWLLREQQRRS